ncbi:hypothetical protein GKE56_12380 [Nostocoides sp. HKS02]|nr:hypothetical protein GKE56_12380 [Tetrasphaera sp. HKS02]
MADHADSGPRHSGDMEVAVLGPVEVNGGSGGLTHRDRVVLAALVAQFGRSVTRDALVDALWGDSVPDSATKVVQGCVVRLRKVLGQAAIETTATGYALRVHADSIDTQRFGRLVTQARVRLADGEPDRTAYLVDQALALWRGPPLAELEDWPTGRVESARLVEQRLDAEDLQVEAALQLGRHREILGQAMTRAEEAPLRERRWALLALAQYRTGRQSDALLTVRRAKAMLVNELGLDPSPELVALEVAILNQDPALDNVAASPEGSPVCPYPGLLPFGVEDGATFFGREADVAACLDRLDARQVLAVVGPSGCGKSSVVRAGVAAALHRDGRRVLVITPGARPLESLAGVEAASGRTLVVDQCEEGLAEEVDPDERARWVDALVEQGTHGNLVIALRSDRVGALAAYPRLARLVEHGLYLLGGMSEPDLRAAIEGPADQSGLRLEPGLADLLVREVRGEPGALPLLSHVLRQTWLRREGATLTVAGYRASGGVREAVAQSADGLYEHLEPAQRLALRDLMLRLVAVAPDGEPMRSRMRRSLVADDPTRAALVEQLVAARLVSTDDQSVEIAHEALAREWPRLRAWLDEDVEGQRILRHLAVSAETWDAMGRPDSELYRGVRLGRALEWRAANEPLLSSGETAFLEASQQAAAAEREAEAAQMRREQRTNRRLRVLLAIAAGFGVLAAGLGVAATSSARRAEAQALAADARRVGAEALTAPRPDTSLLLAAAGMVLEHNSDSAKSNLAAALDRSPSLVHVVRTPPVGSVAVDPTTGRVALSLSGGGVNLYDGRTLRLVARTKDGGGFATTYSPDGRLLVASDVPHDYLLAPDPQPIHLFDQTGSPSPVQLGGIPPRFRSFWSVAFSADGQRLAAPPLRDHRRTDLPDRVERGPPAVARRRRQARQRAHDGRRAQLRRANAVHQRRLLPARLRRRHREAPHQAHRPPARPGAAALPRPGVDPAGCPQPGREDPRGVRGDRDRAARPGHPQDPRPARGDREDHEHRILRRQQAARHRRWRGGCLGPRRQAPDPCLPLSRQRRSQTNAGVSSPGLGRADGRPEPRREHRLRSEPGGWPARLGPHRHSGVRRRPARSCPHQRRARRPGLRRWPQGRLPGEHLGPRGRPRRRHGTDRGGSVPGRRRRPGRVPHVAARRSGRAGRERVLHHRGQGPTHWRPGPAPRLQ